MFRVDTIKKHLIIGLLTGGQLVASVCNPKDETIKVKILIRGCIAMLNFIVDFIQPCIQDVSDLHLFYFTVNKIIEALLMLIG